MRSTENVGLMSQHFLLTAKARSLSLAKVARLSDEEAYQTFKLVRWAATDGQPPRTRVPRDHRHRAPQPEDYTSHGVRDHGTPATTGQPPHRSGPLTTPADYPSRRWGT